MKWTQIHYMGPNQQDEGKTTISELLELKFAYLLFGAFVVSSQDASCQSSYQV